MTSACTDLMLTNSRMPWLRLPLDATPSRPAAGPIPRFSSAFVAKPTTKAKIHDMHEPVSPPRPRLWLVFGTLAIATLVGCATPARSPVLAATVAA
ncbi:MAG: hypothetical protein M3R22_12235, partial [Pseudomonadota bacterium]|nr:hypothetical protein [Pseudomonadota bacterium]